MSVEGVAGDHGVGEDGGGLFEELLADGQLAVVLALMPIAYALRRTVFYRRAVMPWGSLAIASLASVWFVQRALG